MSEFFRYNWDLRGQEATYLVDLDYAGKFDLLGDFTTLIHITCLSLNHDAASFTKREHQKLDEVQQQCGEILGSSGVFVGLIDVFAQRRLYFYTNDAKLLIPLNSYCEKEGQFSLACARASEPNRQTYYRLLYPDAAKRQGVKNAEYLKIMEERGDDLNAFRRVNFHLRFAGSPGLQSFAAEARSMGYAIGDSDYSPEHELPLSLTVHSISRLEWGAITQQTTNILQLSDRYGGTLDYVDSAYVEKRF